jgi:hypothetical protein
MNTRLQPKTTQKQMPSRLLLPALTLATAAASCLPSTKTIKLVSTNSQEIGIFEIAAYDSTGSNVALGSTASSSSTREQYSPSLAIDGDEETYFRSGFGDGEAWFQIQFEDEMDLERIVIKNR